MSVYKQIRRKWLKQLTKEQRKQYKEYVQDIADEMLECYAETIRLNGKATKNTTNWLPMANTKKFIRINIDLQ